MFICEGFSGGPGWRFELDPVSEEGPFVIEVSLNENVITLEDVLFGDVWFCSGQSNMVFEMYKVLL